MGSYTIVQKPPMIVIGIECRTSNAPERGPHDIPKHWGKFYSDDIISRIPNKASNEVVALYCDYEGDYTQPYSLVIGCPVNSLDAVPEGMAAKIIPSGSYAVFNAVGEYPQSLIDTWGNIWRTDLERTYTGDYELYGEKFISGSPKEVEVYIAVQQEPSLAKIDEMVQKNMQMFAAVKKLSLPIGQYAITGSGALGIRNLREIGDLDIIVTSELWDALAGRYGVTDEKGVKKVIFPGGVVEAFRESSFYTEKKDHDTPRMADRIARADMIDGLPFESLEHVLYYKRKMGRNKDLNDIFVIENLLKEKPSFEVRAFIGDIEQVKKKLSNLQALFKGEYAFQDYIYHQKDRTCDLNKELVRLRFYKKTNWNQKPVELAYKLKTVPGRSGSTKFKKQFDSIKEAEAFLGDYKLAFSFHRKGFEYILGGVRIFVEDVEGLPPSVELLSPSKEKIDQLFEDLLPIQILSDSVPKLVESKLNKNRLT